MTMPVPSRYLGVWKRTLLEQKGEQDTSSLVLWMQTEREHADIRIPASRPDFTDCNNLEECSAEQLRWLATQQGFAGVTEVNNSICQWHRQLDFQPKTNARDIGKMAFDDQDTLLETGIDAPYFEVWKKIEYSHLNVKTYQVIGEDRHGRETPSRLLIAGNHFAFVRPRNVILPSASSMLAVIDKHYQSMHTLLDWLDFEISFGEIVDQITGLIQYSTLPFKEGAELRLP